MASACYHITAPQLLTPVGAGSTKKPCQGPKCDDVESNSEDVNSSEAKSKPEPCEGDQCNPTPADGTDTCNNRNIATYCLAPIVRSFSPFLMPLTSHLLQLLQKKASNSKTVKVGGAGTPEGSGAGRNQGGGPGSRPGGSGGESFDKGGGGSFGNGGGRGFGTSGAGGFIGGGFNRFTRQKRDISPHNHENLLNGVEFKLSELHRMKRQVPSMFEQMLGETGNLEDIDLIHINELLDPQVEDLQLESACGYVQCVCCSS